MVEIDYAKIMTKVLEELTVRYPGREYIRSTNLLGKVIDVDENYIIEKDNVKFAIVAGNLLEDNDTIRSIFTFTWHEQPISFVEKYAKNFNDIKKLIVVNKSRNYNAIYEIY